MSTSNISTQTPHRSPPLARLLESTESASWLDRPATRVRALVRPLADGPAGGVLRGDFLGHPLHPALVAVPIGAWSSAAVFDLVFRRPDAARRLLEIGLAATPPTLATGWSDWSRCTTVQRRVGLIHAVTNAAGIALTAASYRRRRCASESSASAVALSLAGLGLIGVGGTLGGHLAYVLGARVSPHADVPDAEANGPAYDPVLAEPVTPADR
ncbi:DUF2231 domain-containing protein [Rhodococcus zopfii]|uniref:DUF2231 domain-containing protein n=1 Tax=Rhodococcus zopfii TaxID=43772 RepID=UPI0011112566|nr:DUF2231 domain-containing protein [Rhodococcus zopfii]